MVGLFLFYIRATDVHASDFSPLVYTRHHVKRAHKETTMGANVWIFGPPKWRFFFALANIIQGMIKHAQGQLKRGEIDRTRYMRITMDAAFLFKRYVEGMGRTLPCPHCTHSCTHFVSTLDAMGVDPGLSCIEMGKHCDAVGGALTPLRYAYTLRNCVNKKLQTQHVEEVLSKSGACASTCASVVEAMFPQAIKYETFVRRMRLYAQHVFEEDLDIVLHSMRVNFYDGIPQSYIDYLKGIATVLRTEATRLSPLRLQAEALEWSLQWAEKRPEVLASVDAYEHWLLQVDAAIRGAVIRTDKEKMAFRNSVCSFYDKALSVRCGEKTCD